ncbi:MAG TPA: hypothetical protein VI455_20705 [Terriglobia bacterium]
MKSRLASPFVHNGSVDPGRSYACHLAIASMALALMVSCGPSRPTLTGPAAVYENAKLAFARGDLESYERALGFLESLTSADPPNDYTNRARVLRAIISGGELEGYKTLSEAYGTGASATKVPGPKSEYTSLERDTMRRGAELTLEIGESAMRLTKGNTIPKDLTLEAPYPSVEPPESVPVLDRVRQGLKIGQDDEAQAALDAPRAGVADALAEVVGGNRSEVRSKMNAGPVPLDSAEFALFLAKRVMAGASLYDKKHLYDPEKFKVLAGIADGAAQASAAALEQASDPEKAKSLKKLREEIKAALKASQS